MLYYFLEKRLKWVASKTPAVGVSPGGGDGCVIVDFDGIYRMEVRLTYKTYGSCFTTEGYDIVAKIENHSSKKLEVIERKFMHSKFSGRAETLKLIRNPMEAKAGDQICVVVNEVKCIENVYGSNILDITLEYARLNGTGSVYVHV